MLIRLFQHNSICWDGAWLNGLERSVPPVSADMRSACARSRDRAGSGTRPWVACADCGERRFIKINLKLIAAHAVIGSDDPLLEIANGAVCQRQHRLRAFAQIDSQGLRANPTRPPTNSKYKKPSLPKSKNKPRLSALLLQRQLGLRRPACGWTISIPSAPPWAAILTPRLDE